MTKLIPYILLCFFISLSSVQAEQLLIRKWEGKQSGGVYGYTINVDECREALKSRLDHNEQVTLDDQWLKYHFENIVYTCYSDNGIKKEEGWASSIPYSNGKSCIYDSAWGGWTLHQRCKSSKVTIKAYISTIEPFKDTL